MSTVRVALTCNVRRRPHIAGYVAECPALGVASQGLTLEEAENNIRDAVGLYLATLDHLGQNLGEIDFSR